MVYISGTQQNNHPHNMQYSSRKQCLENKPFTIH